VNSSPINTNKQTNKQVLFSLPTPTIRPTCNKNFYLLYYSHNLYNNSLFENKHSK